GDELPARAHATSLRAHRRGTLVDLVVAVRAGGETVWEGTSTYLATGARPAGAAPEEPGATSPAEPAVTGDVVAVWSLGADAGRRYAAVSGARSPIPVSRPGARVLGYPRPGTEPEHPGATSPAEPEVTGDVVAVWSIGADTGRRYAEVSGDRNPIHVSRAGARVFGFPLPIAHGMYTAARALAQLRRLRGDAFTWEVEFARPVLLPGRVALSVDLRGDAVRYAGRHPRSGKLHLSGAVTPRT